MNTRYDYEYVKAMDISGWQQHWYNLLDGRFVVQNNELVEDSNAPIFRLGFTVSEVETAIDHSGYTHREIEWYESQPDRYTLVDGEYKQANNWSAKQLKSARVAVQTDNKAACTGHILSKYPMPIQQSAALGVYPATVRDTMADFIGRCIAEENRVFDLAEAATSIDQLAAITPQWPEE